MVKVSLVTKVKKAVFGSVVLSDAEIERLLSSLKVSMLESDVAFDVADNFIGDLGTRLKGKRIESRSINDEVVSEVRRALLDTLQKGSPGFSFDERVRSGGGEPFVILFLGPNGTGKTTTIAKIASRLKKGGVSSVISASDTFRAAAIEQMEHHANRIGVPIIKSVYGADPASIAFDAVAYARARKVDVVLIDSAGRQETNPSLIREMEKMVRVAKPSMIIFVGESTAGNAIANQIVEFGRHMKIDGIVLTKLDCDAKGGGALSISHLTGIPILFFGVGEGYDALVDYTPEFIADAILPKAE
ncbi:MAG: signal recognition particle-docking protein FtsY [Candidatus Micrarchaeota archaeon]|nr:signal recognition particle-docking protein FtsY [Candidatus Micrarchaeota archaeon]